jgi:hypothetical protein
MRLTTALALSLWLVVACTQQKPAPITLDGDAIKAHIQKLASDDMEGRAPGSKGEELATTYIADFYRSIGLRTSFQNVPLAGVTSTVSPLKLAGLSLSRELKFSSDFMAWSKRQQNLISVKGDLVFAGYGVVAPEYVWNDFRDSVKDKIIVVLSMIRSLKTSRSSVARQ